jgi:hypothetical protein
MLAGGILVTLSSSAAVSAGVEVSGDQPPVTTLITGSISDSSDPIGWQPLGPITTGTLLGSGDPPDVAFRLGTAYPLVVWSFKTSLHRDVYFAEWSQTGWTDPSNLTASPVDEADPRVFVEPDGTVHVVWWQMSMLVHEVHWTQRPAGQASWQPPVQVSTASERARRPSVVVLEGQPWFAYERDSSSPEMLQDVVVARALPGGGFERQAVHSTARAERLDVVLHVEQGRLWADWKNGDAEFGCAELEIGQWATTPVPWTDPTWVGVEGVRKQIRQEVVGPD